MQALLRAVGIDAQKVTRRRHSGHYVADFFVPNLQEPVNPSNFWAENISQRVDGLKIIEHEDTVADWRAGQPVIWASVTFALDS
jgi:hypothetical protein